jgi:hypothetical protein
MAIVIDFIRQFAPWIYGACALAALWWLRIALIARHERRYAVFNLEREAALNRTYSAWAAAFVIALLMGGVYLLSTVVSDAVQPLVAEARGTPTPLAVAMAGTPSATPTLPQPETTNTATPTPRPRPTRRVVEPTVEQQPPTATPGPRLPRCPDPRAVITSPGVGAAVSGMVAINGTASHESFQYYKLEYGAGGDPGVWSYFDGGDRQVQGGRLGTLNAGALAPGVYSIRIVVVDASGNFPPPCLTTVVIR